jgi:hypothetical protein
MIDDRYLCAVPLLFSCSTTMTAVVRKQMKRIKENDGRAARHATLRVVLWFVLAQVVLALLYFLFRVEEGPPHVQHILTNRM